MTEFSHLRAAFFSGSELEDLRSLVKGRLFTALRNAVQKELTAMAGVSGPVDTATYPRAKVPVLDVEVARAHLLKLIEINQVQQTFKAELMMEFLIRGGANDCLLLDSYQLERGKAAWGGPDSGRPSARWYLDQLEIDNALHYRFIDSK